MCPLHRSARHDQREYIEAAEALGHPTYGPFAELLYRLCDRKLSRDEAERLYRACGYVPFAGYPLTATGRPSTLGEDDRRKILDGSVLCRFGSQRRAPRIAAAQDLTLEWTWRDPSGNTIVFVRRPRLADPPGFSHDVLINGRTVDRLARSTRPSRRAARFFLEKHREAAEAG